MDLLRILDTKPIPTIVDATTLGISGNTSGDYWLPTTMSLYQKNHGSNSIITLLRYLEILRNVTLQRGRHSRIYEDHVFKWFTGSNPSIPTNRSLYA